MTLLSPWALCGLVVLGPLVISHLRRDRRSVHEVPSLLVWQDLEQSAALTQRWNRVPRVPLLLVLQVLAVILLVLALARPSGTGTPTRGSRIYVLDDSLWMGVPGRLAAASSRLDQLASRLPAGTPVRIVLADGSPRLIYSGDAAGVRKALDGLKAGTSPSTLPIAISLAAGLISGSRDRVVVLRPPEDPLPPVQAPPGRLTTSLVGQAVADQGIFSAAARCGIGGPGRCEAVATVVNRSRQPVTDPYTAYVNGASALSASVRVAAASSADIVLSAQPAERIRVRLDRPDALPVDNEAWVSVPSTANTVPSATVTLVGKPSDALPLARAFASIPGVRLRLRKPSDYRPADALESDLTILDGWTPSEGLPSSPSVLLVDPARIPGGRVGGFLNDSVSSGEEESNGLLAGVDLASLSIEPQGGRRVVLPPYLAAAAWSPDGPLLAEGDDGTQRLAVMAFDPARSDLPQLAAFPVLAADIVRWAAGWAPTAASAGEPVRIDATPGARRLTLALSGHIVMSEPMRSTAATPTLTQPGLYTVSETGPGITRTATVAVNVAAPAASSSPAAPIDLTAASERGAPAKGPNDAPWLLLCALIVIALECTYWIARQPELAI